MPRSKCEYCQKPYVPFTFTLVKTEKTVMVASCDCETRLEAEQKEKAEQKARQKHIEHLYSLSDFSPKMKKCTFETWEQRPGTETAYNATLDFVNDFKRPSGLFLIGHPRTGKTHLAVAATNLLIKNGKPCLFLNMPDFLYRINNIDQESEYYITNILDLIKKVDLLVLNDLGKGNYTEARESHIFNIIDTAERWEIPLIATMNIGATAKFDDSETLIATMSRIRTICGQNIYEITAEGYYKQP